QGWPKLTSHLWMKDREEGLAAVSYAPCTVRTTVGQGVAAAVEVSGEYPFKDRVQIKLSLERPESFPLSLRIPAWCDHPVITLNGHELEFQVTSGYARLVQNWQSGDRLDIHLPMEVRTSSRSMYAASIERGPLVYVLPVKENWQMIQQRDMFHDWEVYPASPWKYGLIADTSFEVLEQDMARQPFLASESPVRVKAQGQLIRDWKMEGNNAGTPPLHPNTDGQPITELELVPYGSARLRIGEFPLIGKRKK
ncbi:hypothetical protein CKO38_18530, partial [Rhodospirillum rubrum]|nr:hypothetical protein [Rhodospirillum rubrum]